MAAPDAWDDGRYVHFVVGPPKASWNFSLWITEADTLDAAIATLMNCEVPPLQSHLSVKVVFRSKVIPLTTRIFDIDMDEEDTFYVVASPLSGEDFDTLVSKLTKEMKFDEDKVLVAVNKYCTADSAVHFLTSPPGQPSEPLMIELRNALLQHNITKFLELFAHNISFFSRLTPDLDYERHLRVHLTDEERGRVKFRVQQLTALAKLICSVPDAAKVDASILWDILAYEANDPDAAAEKLRDILST